MLLAVGAIALSRLVELCTFFWGAVARFAVDGWLAALAEPTILCLDHSEGCDNAS
jgi:hypothetical protein